MKDIIPEFMRMSISLYSTGDEGHVMTQTIMFTGSTLENFEKACEIMRNMKPPSNSFITNGRWMTREEIDAHIREEAEEDE